MKKFLKHQGCFDQSCLLSWHSAWNLAFLYRTFYMLHVWNSSWSMWIFQRARQRARLHYWPTTYRAGAAVVSTITRLEALVMHATRCNIWQAIGPASRLTCASSGKEFEGNFGGGSLHARGLPRTPTSEPARRLQAINLQLVFPSQLRSFYWKASEQPLMSELKTSCTHLFELFLAPRVIITAIIPWEISAVSLKK